MREKTTGRELAQRGVRLSSQIPYPPEHFGYFPVKTREFFVDVSPLRIGTTGGGAIRRIPEDSPDPVGSQPRHVSVTVAVIVVHREKLQGKSMAEEIPVRKTMHAADPFPHTLVHAGSNHSGISYLDVCLGRQHLHVDRLPDLPLNDMLK